MTKRRVTFAYYKWGSAARAPCMNNVRRYLLPRLLIASSRGLPPVVDCRGTRPSQAARSLPRAKDSALPIAAVRAVAIMTPTPGIDASRRASARCLAQDANSLSNAAIRIERRDPTIKFLPLRAHVADQGPYPRTQTATLLLVHQYSRERFLPGGAHEAFRRARRLTRRWTKNVLD